MEYRKLSGSTDPLFLNSSFTSDDGDNDQSSTETTPQPAWSLPARSRTDRPRQQQCVSTPSRVPRRYSVTCTPTKKSSVSDLARSLPASPWRRSFRSCYAKPQQPIAVYPRAVSRLSSCTVASGLGPVNDADMAASGRGGRVSAMEGCEASQLESLRLLYYPGLAETPANRSEASRRTLDQSLTSGGHNSKAHVRATPQDQTNGHEQQQTASGTTDPGRDDLVAYILETLRINVPDNDDILYWDGGIVFIGKTHKNMPHGSGTMVWPSIAGTYHQYFGQFVEGRLCGFGEMIWCNGKRATGCWRDSRLSGVGTIVWPSGNRYDGHIERNVAQGEGEYTWSNGKSLTCSAWSKGEPHGESRYTFADGSVYKGQLRNGERHGKWVHRGKDYHRQGLWQCGSPQGYEVTMLDKALTAV
eukprot:scpid65086/ scgid35022/ Phosphatidylinositol 4-phosphate 5-kinase 5; 1-phosphatidylinositol 4-phosphate kinase 5; Diphosphoinositide kinase 5; PtdIns(4)P-5-kinase 5